MDAAVRARGSYVFDRFRLDPARRDLSHDGVPIALTPTVFETLLCLVENAGRVVTKDELLAAVWPGRFVEEFNLTQAISTLRRALNAAAPEARLIVTAPGRGYRFTAEVRRETGDSAAQPEISLGDMAPMGAPRRGRWRFPPVAWTAAICALLVIAGATVIARRFWAVPPRANRVLVVAEFQNLTGEAIFDRTLGKALEIDLDQSPLLSVLSEQQVQDTLALMTRSKDERVTRPVAQEVCARNNGAGVLQGTIAPIGAKYLLTLTATDCDGTRMLAARKAEAGGRDAVVGALDRLVGTVRGELGESRASVQASDAPLQPEKTVSLAALKAFSEGTYLHDHGHGADSIPLFKHAIELDPKFAAAYASLSRAYSRFHEIGLARINSAKAYDLRDSASERERFNIILRYDQVVAGDLGAQVRDGQLWSESYPRDPAPWLILAAAHERLGEFGPEKDAARRALALGGTEEAYARLAMAYWLSGDLDGSLAVCDEAARGELAGESIHLLLLRIALGRGNQAAAAKEMAWLDGKPSDRQALLIASSYAFGQGQVRRAMDLFGREQTFVGSHGFSDIMATGWVEDLADLGLTDRARALLNQIHGDADSLDFIYVLAQDGDPARARRMLAEQLRERPADTLLHEVDAPEVNAVLAIRRGQPREAIGALSAASSHESVNLLIPYLRGLAYLRMTDGADAAREFQKVLDWRAVHPIDSLIPLAILGHARALKMEGDVAASRRDYQAFLALWKDADPDLPLLKAAKAEYAAL